MKIKNKNLKIINLDLSNKNSLNKLNSDFTYIFHFAAIIGVKYVLENPYKVLQKNSEMTINIISLAKKQKN